MSSTWNPELYLKFKKERTQPAKDLCRKIELDNPQKILDIGCGPGNSTAILRERWPDSEIIGLDSSPEMINVAKSNYPEGKWLLYNAADYCEKGFDLIFSNAAIHWIDNHHTLLPHFMSLLNKNGILAVQIPANRNAGINKAIYETTKHENFKEFNFQKDFTYKTVDFYYEILRKESIELSLWETDYFHILESHMDIVQWYKSTGLKGYLNILPDEKLRKKFEDVILENCKKEYISQNDNKVLFSFNRLFFTAIKTT